MTPRKPKHCRSMAAECLRRANRLWARGESSKAYDQIERSRELTVLALKLEQDSILSNSVPASSQALTDKPGSVTPPLSGTNSAVKV